MAQLFDHRARVSASTINRTLDAIGECMTFQCGAWGTSHNSSLIYQAIRASQCFTDGQVADGAGGWHVPFEAQPCFSSVYRTIAGRYQLAGLRRTAVDTLTPNVQGADLIIGLSGLKDPPAIDGHEHPTDPSKSGWLYGDKLWVEDDGQTPITYTPTDNWAYPMGLSVDGVSPWALNPNVAGWSPYWNTATAAGNFEYDWAPAIMPSIGINTLDSISAGLDMTTMIPYGASILSRSGFIGLPLELQIGCKPKIVSAKCEVNFVGAEFLQIHTTQVIDEYHQPVPTHTSKTTNMPMGFVLLAGKTRADNWTIWETQGVTIAGTYVEGKSCVVDVTELLQRMVDLADGTYDSFCLLPSIAAEWVEPSAGRNMLVDLLDKPPVWAWDDTAGWYIQEAWFSNMQFGSFTLSPPVVTVQWPDSELDRSVYPMPLPPMD